MNVRIIQKRRFVWQKILLQFIINANNDTYLTKYFDLITIIQNNILKK